ncbi:MAG: hypothetical protein AAB613_03080, partial [Patescibacteria group bacterium]
MGKFRGLMGINYKRAFYLLAIASILVLNLAPQKAFAVRPDSLKDVITDSRPSTAANHTITLNQSTSGDFSVGDTIVLTFAAAFDTSGFASTDALDYDITVNGVEETIVDSTDACAGDTIEITTVAADVFTFTACGAYGGEAAGVVIVIEIGTHAASGGAGNTQITNSTAAAYNLAVDSTDEDSQDTIIVVTAAITVSATIDEVLTLAVAAVVAGSCTTTGGTAVTSTATTIPWGTINTEAFYDVCQQLTVNTNAGGGYTVTVYTVAGLDSGANAFAVGSCDGACTLTTPSTWATATNNGYAVCMDDTTGNGAATANAGWDTAAEECGGAGQKFELVADIGASDTPSTIMSSATGVSTDVSLAGWRISADAAQAAG